MDCDHSITVRVSNTNANRVTGVNARDLATVLNVNSLTWSTLDLAHCLCL